MVHAARPRPRRPRPGRSPAGGRRGLGGRHGGRPRDRPVRLAAGQRGRAQPAGPGMDGGHRPAVRPRAGLPGRRRLPGRRPGRHPRPRRGRRPGHLRTGHRRSRRPASARSILRTDDGRLVRLERRRQPARPARLRVRHDRAPLARCDRRPGPPFRRRRRPGAGLRGHEPGPPVHPCLARRRRHRPSRR